VKDILLFEPAAAREREAQRLRNLAAVHRVDTPPSELRQPLPRRVRWGRRLKVAAILYLLFTLYVLFSVYGEIIDHIAFVRKYAPHASPLATALVVIIVLTVLVELTPAAWFWFRHLRPTLLLLQQGAVARAIITNTRRTPLSRAMVEFSFTTECGEHVRRTNLIAKREAPLFNVSDSVWVLYLPRRPKVAIIYGCKFVGAEIIAE